MSAVDSALRRTSGVRTAASAMRWRAAWMSWSGITVAFRLALDRAARSTPDEVLLEEDHEQDDRNGANNRRGLHSPVRMMQQPARRPKGGNDASRNLRALRHGDHASRDH